jgi:hypothetical protein
LEKRYYETLCFLEMYFSPAFLISASISQLILLGR